MNAASARRHECNTHLRSSRRQEPPPGAATATGPVPTSAARCGTAASAGFPTGPNPPICRRGNTRQRSTSRLASKEGPNRKIVQERGAETQKSTRRAAWPVGLCRRVQKASPPVTPEAHQATHGPPKLLKQPVGPICKGADRPNISQKEKPTQTTSVQNDYQTPNFPFSFI
ncbi:hypothetical protein [Oryza sativa Japonica Group]|uniref:Uncharacterized protein n=1 Tax=Oryza sativa subsp. japonica TaxID=39947 RepID=Q5VQN5_ORYSJ|nr:hypothetical protein [Oryza sativa Japonica Group]BAD68239.1 hypothetical protein [Oryza sativa Japonica Group]